MQVYGVRSERAATESMQWRSKQSGAAYGVGVWRRWTSRQRAEPLDRTRAERVGGSVGGGQLGDPCPWPPPPLYTAVTGALQPLMDWAPRSGADQGP